MAKCETQIDYLKEELEADIWTFRWLWLINLGAVVWGIVTRHYDVIAIGAISAIVAMIGIGRTRRGRRLMDRVANVCLGVRRERDSLLNAQRAQREDDTAA